MLPQQIHSWILSGIVTNVTADLGKDCTVQNDPGQKRNVTTADTLMDLVR